MSPISLVHGIHARVLQENKSVFLIGLKNVRNLTHAKKNHKLPPPKAEEIQYKK